jgi:serine/threonine-protein kinase HipA
MARAPAHAPLDVYLNSRLVGRLRRESSGSIDFQYDAGWLGWEHAIPVSVSLPLREDRYIGEPVIAVFENLLPDNDAIKRRVAERSHAQGTDVYSLLSAIGRDCVGALQFVPGGVAVGAAGHIEGEPLSDKDIGDLISSLARNPLGIGDDRDFRISIAGAQEKTALLFWKNEWHRPHGTTATTHILKPQIGNVGGIDLSNSVENEFLCLELTRAMGLPVAKAQMIEFAGRKVLAVERFDRAWTADGRLLRIPQEDCCQALSVPPSRKYESDGGPGVRQLTELMKASDAPLEDQRTVFKAQIVFWLLGAIDGHAKNFSIRLSPGGRFRLTPLYDIVSAQPSLDRAQIRQNQMKLAMAIGDNRHYLVHTITGRHFLQTAKSCGISEATAKQVMEELADTGAHALDGVLSSVGRSVPADLANQIATAAKGRLGALHVGR